MNHLEPDAPETSVRWYGLSAQKIFRRLSTRATGLKESEAKARLEKYGPNLLPRQSPPNIFLIFLRQFQSPLIYILGVAAAVSVAIGENTDAAFIAGVLLINAIIGGYEEWRADRSSRALEKLLEIEALVSRDGEARQISAEGVVPGDLVWLEPGDRVPADIRLLEARGLEIDESTLTGESLAVLKNPQWTSAEEIPVGDRHNMAFAGSTVARGRGEGIVVRTGTQTLIGQLAMDVIGTQAGKAPLLQRLERFTKIIGFAVLTAAFAVSGIGLLKAYGIKEMFFFAVALAVSAIPEGLPVAVTVALSIATNRMASKGVIVRKLAAVEGLGSCTYIGSDKTGTLTCNELTAQEIFLSGGTRYQVSGTGFEPSGEINLSGEGTKPETEHLQALLRTAVLCNEGDLRRRDGKWVYRGDPTDIALLTLGHKGSVAREQTWNQYPQINSIPFEPENQFAASFHQAGKEFLTSVKGAPEKILSMCEFTGGERERESEMKQAQQLAEQGFRVLAFAEKLSPEPIEKDTALPTPKALRFLGFVGMIDPLRPGVIEALHRCRDAGIQVAMITGDHPLTALAISRQLGLAEDIDQVLTGPQLQQLSDEALAQKVRSIKVYSRVAPHEKLRIVEACKNNQHFVAMTGDGVNDAPALRSANIGVAMGKAGTDVARDASDIVISDDNFATIVNGVEEGRVAYNNVRNVIYLLISTGMAEVVMVALSIGMGLPLPLLPVQLLWLNLVTNGIQDVALAFEPGLGNELKQKPRPSKERIFNRLMVERTVIGALVMGCVSLGAFYYLLQLGWTIDAARNAILLLMVLFENVHLGNCRSETRSALTLSPLRSPFLTMGAVLAFSIHLLSMYTPLGQKLLATQPINLASGLLLFSLALSILIVMEIHKWSWNKRHQ